MDDWFILTSTVPMYLPLWITENPDELQAWRERHTLFHGTFDDAVKEIARLKAAAVKPIAESLFEEAK